MIFTLIPVSMLIANCGFGIDFQEYFELFFYEIVLF